MQPQASAQEVQPCCGLPKGKQGNRSVSLLMGNVHQLSELNRMNFQFTSMARLERLIKKKTKNTHLKRCRLLKNPSTGLPAILSRNLVFSEGEPKNKIFFSFKMRSD